jgi:hypothetical protein
MFLRLFAPGVLNENSPHCLSRRSEEMPATVPLRRLRTICESNIRFMHQGSRVQRLTGLLVSQPLSRQFAQFVIDEWQQLLRRPRIAGIDGIQDLSDTVH